MNVTSLINDKGKMYVFPNSNYNYKKFESGISFTNIFAQKDNGSLETDTDGYSVLNMNANYNLLSGKQDLKIFLKIS